MITISSVSKTYRKCKVLENIHFSISPGQCVGIAGANGCGKTTLLSIIAGYLKADSGILIIDEQEYGFQSPVLREYIGYVPQENPLMDELTVYDNLKLWYTGSKLDLEDELDQGVLRMLGIHNFVNKKITQLSGGMKKRLSIGIALANNPKLLILDEPGAALDLACKAEIRNYIASFCGKGGCVILVSHDEADLSLCDCLYLLKNGTLTPTTYQKLMNQEIYEYEDETS
jgi:ABC-2 type transport system ATP-binding protein